MVQRLWCGPSSYLCQKGYYNEIFLQDLQHQIPLPLCRRLWAGEKCLLTTPSPTAGSPCPKSACSWQREQEVRQQAQQEGTEGQPDTGHPAGHVLRGLAPLLCHQCDTGKQVPGFSFGRKSFFFFFQWKLQLTLTVSHQAVCDCVPAGFFDVLTWLGYCNSTMNPIIYPLFMRDFKRAMGKYLPCCRRTGEPRPSAISLSMKNSNSGPRAATSLKNVLTLQAETDSVVSEVVANEHRLLPAAEGALPAPSAHLVGLFEMETSELELQRWQLGTPVA